ncbi:MAG TPA: HD-GYP domain-containing protein [Acidobacteriaceae bacterium]|nr:HD-GYP domain-containing protein [Acidobacteriaceae bacterium]
MTPTSYRGNSSQVKRNPHLWVIYLSLLLPAVAGGMSLVLAANAFHSPGVFDRIIKLLLAIAATVMSIKCWTVTWNFSRDMRQFLETLQAIKRGEFILRSGRAGLPEIEELARELSGLNESPDTSLSKWILLSRDHHAIFVRLVEAMSASMSTKSFYARGHSGRVAEYSTLICKELGLSPEESMRIRLSALLHDIGKIGMDQQILTKPAVLTPDEFAILKTHTTRGAEMLRPVPEFADLLPGVELHHESMDGSGYPHGLKGDQIPLMARVIAVADTFDAMTHNRTYQDAMDGSYVIRIIRTMAGKKFDERAVEAFCRAYSAGLVVLPKRHEEDREPTSPLTPELARIPAGVLPDEALRSPSLVTAGGVDTLKL